MDDNKLAVLQAYIARHQLLGLLDKLYEEMDSYRRLHVSKDGGLYNALNALDGPRDALTLLLQKRQHDVDGLHYLGVVVSAPCVYPSTTAKNEVPFAPR